MNDAVFKYRTLLQWLACVVVSLLNTLAGVTLKTNRHCCENCEYTSVMQTCLQLSNECKQFRKTNIVVVSEKWGNRTGDVWAVESLVVVNAWKASYPVPEFWASRQQRKGWSDWVMSRTHEQSFIRLTRPVPGPFAYLYLCKRNKKRGK